MIPKKIHYIWFGGNPLTPLAERCIASWRKYMPDYEIVRWDESNFDVTQNQYCNEAYKMEKWAFASDYARLWVLVNEGGIYLDTDVEALKPFDVFLGEEAFSGFEATDRVSTGVLAAQAHQPFFEKLLHGYDERHFIEANGKPDLTTNVSVVTEACVDAGLRLDNTEQTVDGLTIYPTDWFCPKDWLTREVQLTKNSYAIHHFDGSWEDGKTKLKNNLMHLVGPKGVRLAKQILGRK